MRFDHPTAWTDKYESYISANLFGEQVPRNPPLPGAAPFKAMAIYAKCVTYHFGSEAIWRADTNRVRLAFEFDALINLLATARRVDEAPMPKIYIGRARYMYPPRIRQALVKLRSAPPPKFTSSYAVPPLLMKREGFDFENEIRICMVCPPDEPAQKFVDVVLEGHGIKEMMINPYADQYMSRGLIASFEGRGFEVLQSRFDLDPHYL